MDYDKAIELVDIASGNVELQNSICPKELRTFYEGTEEALEIAVEAMKYYKAKKEQEKEGGKKQALAYKSQNISQMKSLSSYLEEERFACESFERYYHKYEYLRNEYLTGKASYVALESFVLTYLKPADERLTKIRREMSDYFHNVLRYPQNQ